MGRLHTTNTTRILSTINILDNHLHKQVLIIISIMKYYVLYSTKIICDIMIFGKRILTEFELLNN